MPMFEINGRPVGPDHPPFLIAEAGINHNGDVSLALEMIRAAKSAAADAIKFQTFKAVEFVGGEFQTRPTPTSRRGEGDGIDAGDVPSLRALARRMV